MVTKHIRDQIKIEFTFEVKFCWNLFSNININIIMECIYIGNIIELL